MLNFTELQKAKNEQKQMFFNCCYMPLRYFGLLGWCSFLAGQLLCICGLTPMEPLPTRVGEQRIRLRLVIRKLEIGWAYCLPCKQLVLCFGRWSFLCSKIANWCMH